MVFSDITIMAHQLISVFGPTLVLKPNIKSPSSSLDCLTMLIAAAILMIDTKKLLMRFATTNARSTVFVYHLMTNYRSLTFLIRPTTRFMIGVKVFSKTISAPPTAPQSREVCKIGRFVLFAFAANHTSPSTRVINSDGSADDTTIS